MRVHQRAADYFWMVEHLIILLVYVYFLIFHNEHVLIL